MSLLLTLGLGSSGAAPTPPTGGDTPYMNLLLPIVSVTLGPLYATEVNAAFLRVDGHDHSDGYGKLVGTNGLNINAPLSFHGNDATNLNSAQFNIQSHTAGLVGQVYMSGQDLYCVDGAGNIIQITAAGAVNVSGLGSWTGLIAPAQAGYSSVTKKFSLKSNTTGPKFGLLEIGDIFLFPGDPNLGTLPYIRLATPNTGVSSYTWQFPPAVPPGTGKQQLLSLKNDGTVVIGPTPPAATSFLRMDSNGVPAADVTIDTGTMQLAGAGPYVLGVKPQGINTPQIATGAVTADKQPVIGWVKKAINDSHVNHTTYSCPAITPQTSSAFPGNNARTLMVVFGPDGAGSIFRTFSNFPQITFTLKIGGSTVSSWILDNWNNGAAQNHNAWFTYMVAPNQITAASHVFSLTIDSTGSDFSVTAQLSVTEL